MSVQKNKPIWRWVHIKRVLHTRGDQKSKHLQRHGTSTNQGWNNLRVEFKSNTEENLIVRLETTMKRLLNFIIAFVFFPPCTHVGQKVIKLDHRETEVALKEAVILMQ